MKAIDESCNVISNTMPRLQWHIDELNRLASAEHREMDEQLAEAKLQYMNAVMEQFVQAVGTVATVLRHHQQQ